MSKAGKKSKIAGVIALVLSAFFVFLGFSIIWCLRTWKHLSMEELVYELSAPLEGTGSDMIIQFVINSILPVIVLAVIAVTVSFAARKKGKTLKKSTIRGVTAISFLFAAICIGVFWGRLDVTAYLKNMGSSSTFIEDNFVDAKTTKLTFPERKRNLIYIFLESMETTYADTEVCGGFDFNCIPELTKLSQDNENFSSSEKLNGGVVLPGTTWTMGGMFAQTTGLPLKIEIGENMMETQESFFPGITTMGDILQDAGYTQVLAIGSRATFGGRQVYFQNHGDYILHDYAYALNTGLIPSNYYVFWGFEDEKLFDFAKKDLTELAAKDEPFNYTMLTVDSHFENGYVCDLCGTEFGDNQYANVMACSSRQILDFINWIKEQDFYENTTIVLSGDHTTMDGDFCDDVAEDYTRKTYTAILNSAVEKQRDDDILFSTLDMFPTTLAAMGVEIEGNRLGLGTNLFSEEKTILEQDGKETVTAQLKKGSEFMNSLSGIDLTDPELVKGQGWEPDADTNVKAYDAENETITLVVDDIVNVSDVTNVQVKLFDDNGTEVISQDLEFNVDRSYSADISIAGLQNGYGKMVVTAQNADGEYDLDAFEGYVRYLAHDNLADYIKLIKGRDDIAVIMGMCDEAVKRVRSNVFKSLKKLGISLELKGNKGASFYAVIDNGEVAEDMSLDSAVTYEGVLRDGAAFSVLSAARSVGNRCSIVIDGVDYAVNATGLNFVIYDYNRHEVVDSACFNVVSPTFSPRCNTSCELNLFKAKFTLTDIKSADDLSRNTVHGEIWDARTYKKVKEFDLQYNGDKTFSGEVGVLGLDTSDCYVKIYMFNGKTLEEKMITKWHGDLKELKKE